MKTKILTFVISLIIINICHAQQIGQWTVHTPGKNVGSMAVMHEKIYAATPYDVFFVNSYDNSINRITKVNGLSDIGISVIRYGKDADVIMICYNDCNIDIIDNNDAIYNLSDIKDKNTPGNKVINDVFFKNSTAYVCCGFGIVAINLKRMEVIDTYTLGDDGSNIGVNDLTVFNGKFYAATTDGLYTADESSTNFLEWSVDTSITYPYVEYKDVEVFSGKLIANAVTNDFYDEMFANDGNGWSPYLPEERYYHKDINACGDKLVMVNDTVVIYQGVIYHSNRNMKAFNEYGQCVKVINSQNFNSAIYDQNRNCYNIGTSKEGMVQYNASGNKTSFYVDGTYSNYLFDIKSSNNDVWIASGGYAGDWSNRWIRDGLYHYNGDKWSYLNGDNTLELNGIVDMSCVAISHSNSNKIYAGSYMGGVVCIENNTVKAIYDNKNSSLGLRVAALSWAEHTCVTGLDFDSKGTLWVANSGADKLLSSMTSSGTWEAYNVGSGGGDISQLMVDKNDYVWIQQRAGTAIVFNGSTYKTVGSTSGQGGLPGTIQCITKDLNGNVWIGTTDGVGVFYNTKKIFENNSFNCSKILVPRNDGTGLADYLLSGQAVNCIAVDGANKMWFGTSNGAFYTSNDGLTEYLHFTTDNSPLLSNNIQKISVDGEGNVYFVTENGLISYKNGATTGGSTNSNVVVYPNPVYKDYTGYVGIKGLVSNALVKITTTSGAFVTHLRAEGGQAVWNCTDIKGNKVRPGVYIVFVSDDTGKETCVNKILIL